MKFIFNIGVLAAVLQYVLVWVGGAAIDSAAGRVPVEHARITQQTGE